MFLNICFFDKINVVQNVVLKDTRSCFALEEYVKNNYYSRQDNLHLLMLQRNTLSY